jgi:sigma-B regulation protein RsbU (phosphoserine phosphatase)
VSGGDAPVPIGVSDLMIGAVPAVTYATSETTVPPDSTIYLFSDGVFEIMTKEEQPWRLGDFVRLLAADNVGKQRPTPAGLYDSVKARVKNGAFEDDFSLVSIMFA